MEVFMSKILYCWFFFSFSGGILPHSSERNFFGLFSYFHLPLSLHLWLGLGRAGEDPIQRTFPEFLPHPLPPCPSAFSYAPLTGSSHLDPPLISFFVNFTGFFLAICSPSRLSALPLSPLVILSVGEPLLSAPQGLLCVAYVQLEEAKDQTGSVRSGHVARAPRLLRVARSPLYLTPLLHPSFFLCRPTCNRKLAGGC